MNTQGKLLALTSVLGAVQPSIASAATVDFTTADPVAATSVSSPFFLDVTPDVVQADSLLSIEGGTVSGFEFSTFRLYARFDGFPDQQIHQFTFPGGSGLQTYNLNLVPVSNFTEHTLIGLVFSYTGNLNIPAGTTFSFDSNAAPVPEPASVTLWAGGAVGAALVMRRRRRDETADAQGE